MLHNSCSVKLIDMSAAIKKRSTCVVLYFLKKSIALAFIFVKLTLEV